MIEMKITYNDLLKPNSLREEPNFPLRARFKQLSQLNQFNSDQVYDNEQYLSDLIKVLKIKSLVVGVGGAGNNTISRLQEIGLEGTETLNINTDAHDLYYSNSNQKVLIGKDSCNGMGSGNNPSIGAEAAKEDARLVVVDQIEPLLATFGRTQVVHFFRMIGQAEPRNSVILVTYLEQELEESAFPKDRLLYL